MLKLLALGGVVASILVAPTSNQVLTNPPGKVTIAVETVNGSGCPAGSATVTPSADNTSFTVTYDDYVARAGGAAKPTEFRKNCQLSLLINLPQGFTFAIARADYHGELKLARTATAQQNAYYYLMGTSPTAEARSTFAGPRDGSWHTSTVAEAAALVYANCGAQVNLNVNTELRVNAGEADKSTNYISMDASKGSIRTVFHFSWKQC